MYENLFVGLVVLACLIYAVRKIVRILRGKESDGCAFCSGGATDKGCRSCIGCAKRNECAMSEQGGEGDRTDSP